MPFERPLIERKRPDAGRPEILRAIISPCTGCKNNVQVPVSDDEVDSKKRPGDWPCPKQRLYARRQAALRSGDRSANWDHPVFDESLRGVNPVWPGILKGGSSVGNNYAYVFVATFEDNVDTGWNPEWDTAKIRCRGPILLASPERHWNLLGHPEQRDGCIYLRSYYYLDGAEFEGFALEAAVWQTASGYVRKIDSNPGRTLSGASRFE